MYCGIIARNFVAIFVMRHLLIIVVIYTVVPLMMNTTVGSNEGQREIVHLLEAFSSRWFNCQS